MLFCSSRVGLALLALLLSVGSGCIKKMALNSLANSMSEGGTSAYANDDDPKFVGEALPFALKMMETLLQSVPEHQGLLVSAASGFVQYGHAYILRPAEELESEDYYAARQERERAKRMFLRAKNYGMKALELRYPGIDARLTRDPEMALKPMTKRDVPALYWTGVAWGSAMSVGQDDMALVSDLRAVEEMLERALSLDEAWNDGAIHEFFILYDAGRSEAEGGGIASAEEHFNRAMELNQGMSIGPLVSLAESVCVQLQDYKRFKELLNQALEFDADQHEKYKLVNRLTQHRARFLLDKADELFFVIDEEE